MSVEELIELERKGWEALSAGGETARAFYERVLDDHVVMLFPGGMVLDDRVGILDSLSGPPWSGFELQDLRAFEPHPDTGIVTYGVVAHRDDREYSALLSSVYIRRDGAWKLALHQQTPR